jgi:hypothetical protein
MFQNRPPPHPPKIVPFMRSKEEKYRTARQAADDNIAHVHCMMDNYGYIHTHTHTQYAIIIAFPLQQWLQERSLLLRYTYFARIVIFSASPMAAIYTYRLENLLKFRDECPFAMLFNHVFALIEYSTVQFRFLMQLITWMCVHLAVLPLDGRIFILFSFCKNYSQAVLRPFLKRDCERTGVDVLVL